MTKKEEDLKGLGGWLILVGIGVVLSPIRIIGDLMPIYLDIPWKEVMSEFPLLGVFIVFEILVNVFLVGASIYLIFLFFSKNIKFPKLYYFLLVFSIGFIFIDAFIVKLLIPEEPMFDPETSKQLFQSIISFAIWGTYILIPFDNFK